MEEVGQVNETDRRRHRAPAPAYRPESIHRFVGVDLATEPRRTGVAILTTGEGGAVVDLPEGEFVADDRGLVDLVDENSVVGLDAPLGWPDDFVAAVTAHRMSARWPSHEHRSADRIRESLQNRTTDLFVRRLEVGSRPMSVSADRIGAVAMRAAGLQSAWARRWGRLEPRDGSARLVETYPVAALKVWGLRGRDDEPYKGKGGPERRAAQRGERARMLAALAEVAPWLHLGDAVTEASLTSDHAFDAVICALVALAAHLGLTHAVPPGDRETALREGWIHVPRAGTLAEIGASLAD